MKKHTFFFLAFILILLASCINEEGEGGTSTIEGKVFKVFHLNDVYNFEADTFPAAKEDVYIVYGNQHIYGDKMETGFDGYFRFRYLTPGTYKIYAYSTYINTQKIAEIDTITVAYGKTAKTNDIYIHEGKSYNTSYIKGVVNVIYYNNKGIAITTQKSAYDVRVFIKQKGAAYHFDEIRTSLNGEFMFQNLKTGDYEVFVLTEDPFTEALSPVTQTVTISSIGVVQIISSPFNITLVV